jgi:Type I site-specific restriction-modification system, R (restriction) subunit and related helicases
VAAGQPLITKPSVPMKDLAMSVMMGARDEETVRSLAGRLARLNKQLSEADQQRITEKTGGLPLPNLVSGLLHAIDADHVDAHIRTTHTLPPEAEPEPEQRQQAQDELVKHAATPLNGEVIELLDTIRRDKEQKIDHENLDEVRRAEWDGDAKENAQTLVQDFESYLAEHRDEIDALHIFYSQPARRREVTYAMIRSLLDTLRADRPRLMPVMVWRAYALLDEVKQGDPQSELTALVALIRRASGIDPKIARYSDTVRKNFRDWIMQRHSGGGQKFDEAQWHAHMIATYLQLSYRARLESAPRCPCS